MIKEGSCQLFFGKMGAVLSWYYRPCNNDFFCIILSSSPRLYDGDEGQGLEQVLKKGLIDYFV